MGEKISPGQIPGVPSAGLPAGPVPAWPGEFVTLGVGDVFVRFAGAKAVRDGSAVAEPAMYVHGLGGSSRNWTDLMDLLSHPGPEADDPVLAGDALDLPGFGFSPPSASGNYSIGARAAAVIALIDKRGNWPVHLVGNSLGGAVATRVAARRPDLVKTLTLISPALPDLTPRNRPLWIAAMGLPVLGRWLVDRMTAFPAEQRTAATVADLYADPSRMHPDRFREEVEEVIRRDALDYQAEVVVSSTRAIVTEYTRRGPGSLWGDAARVSAPTLVIHGANDRVVNPAMAARAARAFRFASAVVLPQTGHVAQMERPGLVARLMREFFRAVASPQPGSVSGAALSQVPG
jgi:pimeloyl-ACP methyl ester carboxylesterase